ncbi:FtsK/SpoIIIE domain-containing protein [Priestia flexa]|uniref:FtsK/SpoIIIE domain-containing protein n=1 Tax=Priestia flexa TaxID=86664 RepID=UPI002490EC56|nr:FtsK/SpoIIIE domain-containing protein [Priestia flexa]
MFEIISSAAMGGVLLFTTLKKGSSTATNDHEKIKQICSNCGLYNKANGKKQEIVIQRKKRHKDHTEYIYKIPLGMSFQDFQDKAHVLQDGLNNKKEVLDISFNDIKQIRLNKDLIQQVKTLLSKKKKIRKEVMMSFDGALRIKVYEQNLIDYFGFDVELFEQTTGWKIYVGESRNGAIIHDTESGHIVIAGATTFGKSNFLKMFIANLLYNKPDDTKLTLIDLKGGLSFARYYSLKQCSTLALDLESSLEVLEGIVGEMKVKQASYLEKGFENIREAKDPERHFIIVDEAAQLSPEMVTGKVEKELAERCQSLMSKITQLGASLGYRLVFATQYPLKSIMPSQVKANSTTKICFRLETATQSGVVLDETGAENIQLVGRCIYKTPKGIKLVQTPQVDNSKIDKLVEPYKVTKEPLNLSRLKNEEEDHEAYTPIFEETE